MGFKGKMGVGCLVFCILSAGINGMPSKAAFDGTQIMEGQVRPQAEALKAVYGGTGIVDSTGNYEYAINENGTAKIIRYLKKNKEVVVPAQLDGHNVTVIAEFAFAYMDFVSSIKLPDTVTDIGAEAFCNTKITAMELPEGVRRIGEDAFRGCSELEKIVISRNVEEIQGNIFKVSRKLVKIDVDFRNPAYTSVDGILYNKDATEILAVPGGKDMTGFQFPESVVQIGEDAFNQCDNETFTEITIPDRVTAMGEGAFQNCWYLEKAVIGKNITVISDAAFMGCSLRQVAIKGDVTVIGANAFCECGYLEKINIPDSVIEIGKDAFDNCVRLKNIFIPKSTTRIGEKAFGFYEDGKFYDISITGYRDTAAYRYAEECHIAFQDADSGETLPFDVLPIPEQRIRKLTAGKKKIKIKITYNRMDGGFYQIAVKKAGTSGWKKHDVPKPSAVIKGLKSGKKYKVRARTLCEIGGELYYGNWSAIQTVTVR